MEASEIKQLEQVVINRIAAGEVVQRPASALKELIENSLDAKATNIQITIQDGGFKLLQVQDNGTGIRRDNFPILCERFTTSKIRKFEDLDAIATYGFRGEALSSISHVAHLSVTAKTQDAQCAYRASYVDGVLVGDVQQIAGNRGTIICAEDLFYNMSVRRAALRSVAEEYSKISDVVGMYAVHNSTVGFSLKKTGEVMDLRTMPSSTAMDNIRVIYGQAIASNLVEFQASDEAFKFAASGLISTLNYTAKSFRLILFINHRLVVSQKLKQCIEQVYSQYLPKNGRPFVYVSIEIDPRHVDVNMHPTKHEVRFLHEGEIVNSICAAIEAKLFSGKESRTFYEQTKLPVVTNHSIATGENTSRVYDKDFVRTDMREQKLEKFFGPLVQEKASSSDDPLKRTEEYEQDLLDRTVCCVDGGRTTSSNFTRHEVKLRSVLAMQAAIEADCDGALRDVFAEHVFVGVVTANKALVQHRVRLLLIDTVRMTRELFYQCIVYNFQNFQAYKFETPLSLRELVALALDQAETGWTPEDGEKHDLCANAVAILTAKSDMLRSYFEIDINDEGMLCSLPVLIAGHMPSKAGLPHYIIRLACDVNWEEEQPCFESFARETAAYYAEASLDDKIGWQYVVEQVLYVFAKEYFLPPTVFRNNGAILELTRLPKLYQVFERC